MSSADQKPSASKSSAHYMRELRTRLRSEGMVSRDVWILPENSKLLRNIEKLLRIPVHPDTNPMELLMNQAQAWSTTTLFDALMEHAIVKNGHANVRLIEGLQPSLILEMKDLGDLPLYAAVTGEQILVQCTLFGTDQVKDTESFNAMLLRSRSMFSLSAISIEQSPCGQEAYVMYGALSSRSTLESVVTEIETLADNVINAVDAFETQLTLNH